MHAEQASCHFAPLNAPPGRARGLKGWDGGGEEQAGALGICVGLQSQGPGVALGDLAGRRLWAAGGGELGGHGAKARGARACGWFAASWLPMGAFGKCV